MRQTIVSVLVVAALTTLAYGGGLRPAPLYPYELPLARALDQEVPPRDLSFRSGVLHFTRGSRWPQAIALLEVSLEDLGTRVEPQTGTWSAHVSMLAYVKDAGGRLVSWMSRDWPLRGTGSPSGRHGRTVMLKRTLCLAPGRYTLEAAVADRASGRVGVRRVPFVVPEASPELSVGSVAVVRFQAVPLDALDPSDPLLVRGMRALPVLGAPIAAESGQVGVLASLHPAPDAGPVSVTVEFRRAGEVLAQASPEIPRPDRDGRITLAHAFALPSNEPGRYEVHVRVRQGRKVASAATSFQIVRTGPAGTLSPQVARAGAWR